MRKTTANFQAVRAGYSKKTANRLTAYEALQVYNIASNKERLQVAEALVGKMSRAKNVTPEMDQMYAELLKPKNR